MKSTRKWLGLLCAFALCMSLLPAAALAEGETPKINPTGEIKNDTYYLVVNDAFVTEGAGESNYNIYYTGNTLTINNLNLADAGISVPGGTTIEVKGNNTIDATSASVKNGGHAIQTSSAGILTITGDGTLLAKGFNQTICCDYASSGIVISDNIKLTVEHYGAASCIGTMGEGTGVEITDNAEVALKPNERNLSTPDDNDAISVSNNGDIKITGNAKVTAEGGFSANNYGSPTTLGKIIITSTRPLEIIGETEGNNPSTSGRLLANGGVEIGADAHVILKQTGVGVQSSGGQLNVAGTLEIETTGGTSAISVGSAHITGTMTIENTGTPSNGMQTTAKSGGGVVIDGGVVTITNENVGIMVAESGNLEIKNGAEVTITNASNRGAAIHTNSNPDGKIILSDSLVEVSSANGAFSGTVQTSLSNLYTVNAGASAEENQEADPADEGTWTQKYVRIGEGLPGSVSIGGTPQVGQTLTAQTADTPEGTALAYKWQAATSADGPFEDIAGANEASYSLTSSDVGKYIRVVVTDQSGKYLGGLTATTGQAVSNPYTPPAITVYAVTVEDSDHGNVKSNCTAAGQGSVVTLTVTPDEGYELSGLTVTDSRGNKLDLADKGDGKYTFTMPGSNVTVAAAFTKTACPQDGTCPMNGYNDLDMGAWYHDGIHYCLENGLMNGMGGGVFAPEGTTTRAQLATILWRMAGSPVVDYPMDFDDVDASSWYSEAVRWAASEGVVGGYGNGKFGPNDPITREQFAVMLYRFAQAQGYDVTARADLSGYTDAASISDWALEALSWANAGGIITGTSATTLDPKGQATRAQAAAMLQRFLEK